MARYAFQYGPSTTYGRAKRLLDTAISPGGLVIDLGSGVSPLGPVLREAGFDYLAVDNDRVALEELSVRGDKVALVDLAVEDGIVSALESATGGEPVAAIVALDVIEHLLRPEAVLRELHRFAEGAGMPPLIVSIPNVAHYDLAAKLLLGRWDVTETGLLDVTHVSLFTGERVERVMSEAGWVERGRDDLVLHHSDQHEPANQPALAPGTPLSTLLTWLRGQADPYGRVNQFIRLYSWSPTLSGQSTAKEPSPPGVSVVVRTQGRRDDLLTDALLSLAAQTTSDFEIVLVVHDPRPEMVHRLRGLVGSFAPSFSRRVRILQVGHGGRARPLNAGLEAAAGDLIAFLDDDDVVMANWVETILDGGRERPGHVVRLLTADQKFVRGGAAARAPLEPISAPHVEVPRRRFDLIRHLATNRTPICSFAIPRRLVSDFGLRFREDLPVLEDWDLLLRASVICGVHDTDTTAALYRRWTDGSASFDSESREAWRTARASVHMHLDRLPLLLPPGSVSRLVELQATARKTSPAAKPAAPRPAPAAELAELSARHAKLQQENRMLERRIGQLETSTSWRLTAPIRWLLDRARGRR